MRPLFQALVLVLAASALLARGAGADTHSALSVWEMRKFFKEVTPNFMSLALYDATPAPPGAMAEMLLQSHPWELHVLPALPAA
jgi:hypothetical protein